MALSKRYLWGERVDELLAQEDVTKNVTAADRVLWPIVDHLGTVCDLVKQDGTVATHFVYDAFGGIVSGDASLTRYLFTSREFDVDTGLQYNRARWYDASTGRWISEDPLGFAAGDVNTARYVGNGVVDGLDPSGMEDIAISFVDDWVTRFAHWWSKFVSASRTLVLDPEDPDWDAAKEWVSSLPDNSVDRLITSGHGGAGEIGPIDSDDLKPGKGYREFLEALKPKLKDGAEIIHRHCCVASSQEGKDLIQEEADITGAEVHAWDDWYAVKPWGHEWVARPGKDGPTKEGYWGRYPGSKIDAKQDDGIDHQKKDDKKEKIQEDKRARRERR